MELILEVPLGYLIERLNTTIHRREGFSCGVGALDTYLETQASQAQNKNISTTHVLLEETDQPATDHPIIGYVTLTPQTIPFMDAPSGLKKISKGMEVQAQLIARMAVDSRYQNRKLGQFLVAHALKCCWEISRLSACSAVFVDAKDENLKNNFYIEHFGFRELPDRPSRLYLPIAVVGELVSK